MECPLVARDLALIVTPVYEVRYTMDHFDNQHQTQQSGLYKNWPIVLVSCPCSRNPATGSGGVPPRAKITHVCGWTHRTSTRCP